MVSFSIFKTSYNSPFIEWKEFCIGAKVTFLQGTNISMMHILHTVATEYLCITREFQTGDGTFLTTKTWMARKYCSMSHWYFICRWPSGCHWRFGFNIFIFNALYLGAEYTYGVIIFNGTSSWTLRIVNVLHSPTVDRQWGDPFIHHGQRWLKWCLKANVLLCFISHSILKKASTSDGELRYISFNSEILSVKLQSHYHHDFAHTGNFCLQNFNSYSGLSLNTKLSSKILV